MDKRRFAADDLKELSVCNGAGETIVLEAKAGVIEISPESKEAFAIPILEELAATGGHPVYESEPSDIPSPPEPRPQKPAAGERPSKEAKE